MNWTAVCFIVAGLLYYADHMYNLGVDGGALPKVRTTTGRLVFGMGLQIPYILATSVFLVSVGVRSLLSPDYPCLYGVFGGLFVFLHFYLLGLRYTMTMSRRGALLIDNASDITATKAIAMMTAAWPTAVIMPYIEFDSGGYTWGHSALVLVGAFLYTLAMFLHEDNIRWWEVVYLLVSCVLFPIIAPIYVYRTSEIAKKIRGNWTARRERSLVVEAREYEDAGAEKRPGYGD